MKCLLEPSLARPGRAGRGEQGSWAGPVTNRTALKTDNSNCQMARSVLLLEQKPK